VNVGLEEDVRTTAPAPRGPGLRIALIVAAVLLLAGGGYAIYELVGNGGASTTGAGSAPGDESVKATVLSTAGATVDGANVTGTLQVKADNVHITNATVHGRGAVAIRVFDGVKGTVIEKSQVYCDSAGTDGIGYGNYTAVGVAVHGCGVGFQHSAAAPAVVTGSTWNGKPYTASYTFTESGKVHAGDKAGLVAGPIPWPAQVRGAWPGPTNTGVPRGTMLAKYTGSLDITDAGTVIDGKEINGCVGIKAQNVVIKRSKITCGDRGALIVRVYDETRGGASVDIEDSEIVGNGYGLAVGYGDYTLKRDNIHDINEGPHISDGADIEDCWIHDMVYTSDADHQDIIQTTGGDKMTLRHNTLEAFDPTTDQPFNAAFMVGSETAPLSNVTVENNLMTGGTYTVSIRPDIKATNVHFSGNVFVRNNQYDAVDRETAPGITWDKTNVWADSGQPVSGA